MSQGSFVIAKYETDQGDTRPVRVQPETIIASTNPEGTGTLAGGLIRVSGGKRKIGKKARSMTLKQNIGAPVNGYQATRTITLPVFTKAAFDALAIGQAVTYNAGTWVVTGASPESGK
jgi:hypothetical protein